MSIHFSEEQNNEFELLCKDIANKFSEEEVTNYLKTTTIGKAVILTLKQTLYHTELLQDATEMTSQQLEKNRKETLERLRVTQEHTSIKIFDQVNEILISK